MSAAKSKISTCDTSFSTAEVEYETGRNEDVMRKAALNLLQSTSIHPSCSLFPPVNVDHGLHQAHRANTSLYAMSKPENDTSRNTLL